MKIANAPWNTMHPCCSILLVSMAMLYGCGTDTPRCIPVSGTVTVDGKKVPGPGFIYFNTGSPGQGSSSRPGTAAFDADGQYRAKTFADGDGLLPGKYVLRVDCWKIAPNLEGKPVVSFIAKKYQDAAKSGLELTVEANASAITFDVPLTSK